MELNKHEIAKYSFTFKNAPWAAPVIAELLTIWCQIRVLKRLIGEARVLPAHVIEMRNDNKLAVDQIKIRGQHMNWSVALAIRQKIWEELAEEPLLSPSLLFHAHREDMEKVSYNGRGTRIKIGPDPLAKRAKDPKNREIGNAADRPPAELLWNTMLL